MVSIRKANQSFQLRKRGAGAGFFSTASPADREKVGLVAGGLCVGFLLVVLVQLDVFSSPGPRGRLPQGIPESLRKTKQHPVLTEEISVEEDVDVVAANNAGAGAAVGPGALQPRRKRMDDRFNAVGLDIVEFLDCPKLLEEAVQYLKDDGGGFGGVGGEGGNEDPDFGGDDKINNDQDDPVKRRRLEQVAQQHGDDGGFGNEEGGSGGAAVDPEGENEGDDEIPEDKWGEEAAAAAAGGDNSPDDTPRFDDLVGGSGDMAGGYATDLNAKHLFCLAASENPPPELKEQLKCDAAGRKRRTLLDLWTDARAQIQDPQLLLKVLGLAREHTGRNLLGRSYNLWAPNEDDGLEFMLGSLNNEQDADHGGLHGLEESLGSGKVFVDVGSCLGLTCLAMNTKYPGTRIVSFEPASPSWLLQELNLRCNLAKDEFKNFHVVLAGVGPNTDEEDNTMAKLMWRPTSTTSTRTWTPKSEHRQDDVELVVRLRKLKSILAEADVYGTKIDVMNIDCEGCEYNLIPSLTEEEFDDIPTVLGGAHWGYIPANKLPSSERARKTHERLCQHENIAKTTKECCAFPDLHVKSSVPGEVLIKDTADNGKMQGLPSFSTVSDVIADGMCDDFDKWAEEHFLYDIKEDWGWFELSSEA